jgi:ketosteroid isomerase-like protein
VRSTDPGEKFCSESLAEYSAVLAIEKIEGERAATEFLEYSREGYNPLQSALGYFFMWRDGGDKPLAELAQDKWDHNIADSKGAWVLHMLRQEVGEEIFFAVLRGIIEDHAGDEISLATLEAAFTEDAPGKDVPRFFRQWCYRPGAPVIDIEWWSVDKGKGVEIYLRQRQPGEPFRLQCEVAVEMKGGAVASHTIEIDEASEVHRLEISSRPVSVHLDPAHRLLVWRPEYGPMPPGCDVAPAVAQSTGSSEAADVHRAEAELRETEVAFAATMARRDLRAFASFLSEEAVFMGRSTLRGKAAVVEGWRSFFDAPETPFSWFPDEAVVLESGTLGLTSGPVLDPEGTRIGTFNSVWRHDQGRWTLVFDKGCPPCPQPKGSR